MLHLTPLLFVLVLYMYMQHDDTHCYIMWQSSRKDSKYVKGFEHHS